MGNATIALEPPDVVAVLDEPEAVDQPRCRSIPSRLVRWTWRGIASATEWVFGVVSLILGLSLLASIPLAQFLSLGYLLESSARVARTGRLRDGFIGVRRAAGVGGLVAGIAVSMVPLWLVGSMAESAELIDPGGRVAGGWRLALAIIVILTFLHIATACLRGGKLRHFLWPVGHPFWLVRRLRRGRRAAEARDTGALDDLVDKTQSHRGGLYAEARDGFWTFLASLRLPYYFRRGLVGFLGTLAWLAPPAFLIAAGGAAPLLGIIGAVLLAFVVSFLPFLQVHYAVEGRASAFISPRPVRERFRRAPWAFAFALMVLLLAAIPLYLLKIEMVPREAAWLPSLVFVIFLAPARLLVGWAYARSGRRERPTHWFLRIVGRLAVIPVALFYVLVVFFSQYTSWGGFVSLYEQHAFLLPVPFLSM
jgi:hypothetical protein